MADDLGIDAIDGFGVTHNNYATTPNLDMLRAEKFQEILRFQMNPYSII